MKKYFTHKAYERKVKNAFLSMNAWKRRGRSRRFLQKVFGANPQTPPLTLVDIGASEYLPKHWTGLGANLRVIGFEPDEGAYNDLVRAAKAKKEEKTFTYRNSALHNKTGEADFFITRKQMVSSMLRPNRTFLNEFPRVDRFDILKTLKLKTDTLDNALSFEDIDFIKIDTQGSELFIFQGATETLRKKALGVEVEVEFAKVYENQPLFGEVDQLLREAGFMLLDFVDIARWARKNAGANIPGCKSQVIFANALYIKGKDSLFGESHVDKAKLLRIVAICVLYQCFDYAAALLQEGLEKNLVSDEEYQRILNAMLR